MLSSEVDLFAHCRFLSSANAFAIMEPRFGRVTSVTSKRVPPVQEVRLRQLEASPKIYAAELDRRLGLVENKDIFPVRLVSRCVVALCSVAFPVATASGKQPTNANA